MKILTNLIARILFSVPLATIGMMHFAFAEDMAGMAPFGGKIIVYITGLALLAGAVSILIKKMASTAALLVGVFVILTATTVHMRSMMGGDEMAMGQVLKDLMIAGGAFFMAGVFKNEEEGASAETTSSVGEESAEEN